MKNYQEDKKGALVLLKSYQQQIRMRQESISYLYDSDNGSKIQELENDIHELMGKQFDVINAMNKTYEIDFYSEVEGQFN